MAIFSLGKFGSAALIQSQPHPECAYLCSACYSASSLYFVPAHAKRVSGQETKNNLAVTGFVQASNDSLQIIVQALAVVENKIVESKIGDLPADETPRSDKLLKCKQRKARPWQGHWQTNTCTSLHLTHSTH